MPGPRVAYLLLWFPEPSQTFILDEVNTLVRLGLDVRVYSLYGPRPARRLAGMAEVLAPVHHLGLAALGTLWSGTCCAWAAPGVPRRRRFCGRWRCAGGAAWRPGARPCGPVLPGCTWPGS